jgi:hypothetical protein
VACSLICAETEHPDQNAFYCDSSVASFEPLGDLSREPATSFLGKLLVGVRLKPVTGVGMFLGLLMMVAGVVIVGRTAVQGARRS